MILEKRREKRKWVTKLDVLKRKRVDFTSASSRTRRSRAQLHQRWVIRRLRVMWQIRTVKESQLICVRGKM